MTYTLSNLKVNLTVATVDDGTRSRSEVWGDFDKLPQFVIKHTPSCLITNSGPFDIFNMAACVCVCVQASFEYGTAKWWARYVEPTSLYASIFL